tara:strand:- start:1245 stop:2036 length:792 start_codon:yes stop_codon:yes gene_type:complete
MSRNTRVPGSIARTQISNTRSHWDGKIGLDPSNEQWVGVNLQDGTWTALNVSLTSMATSSSVPPVHTLTFSGPTSSDADKCPVGGTTFDADTWYRPMKTERGTQITSDSNFIILIEWFREASSSIDDACFVFGFCAGDPTNTTLTNREAFGSLAANVPADKYQSGVFCRNAVSTNNNANTTRSIASCTYVAKRVGDVGYHSINAEGGYIAASARNSNYTMNDGENFHLIAMAGSRSTSSTVATGTKMLIKWRYKIIELSSIPE